MGSPFAEKIKSEGLLTTEFHYENTGMRLSLCGCREKGKNIEKAILSATSLRQTDKNAHITLITDSALKSDLFDIVLVRPL